MLLALAGGMPAHAQHVALTTESEAGFQQIISMAQTGQFGADVTNANIVVSEASVRIELVRPDGASKVLLLSPKKEPEGAPRYFDIGVGDGATSADVTRLGSALDQVFGDNPFRLVDDVPAQPFDTETFPSTTATSKYGVWRDVARVLARRLATPIVSREYTVAVIIALAVATAMSLLLLWGSTASPLRSPRERDEPSGKSFPPARQPAK